MTEKVEDSKTQTKNWIKVQLENAIERQNDQINTLSNKVKELENQNKKLKSTIGDLKQELNKSRPKISVKSASVQTPQPQHPPPCPQLEPAHHCLKLETVQFQCACCPIQPASGCRHFRHPWI
jgi:hypothetical protein